MIGFIRSVAVTGILTTLVSTSPVTSAVNAPDLPVRHGQSNNWSGFAVAGHGPYRSVSAQWIQPTVSCQQTPKGYSSFWVGLDGDGTSTVEQIGTEADCHAGTPVYSAWYEMFPKLPVTFPDAVRPNDKMGASVTYEGASSFALVLTNITEGWTETVSAQNSAAALGSAEVIAEAPSSLFGVLPLADFGSAAFGHATVNGSSPSGATLGIDRITMVTPSGTVKAQPTAVPAVAGFVDKWYHQ